MSRIRKTAVSICILLLISCCVLHYQTLVRASGSDLYGNVRRFIEVLNIVRRYYVDDVSIDKLVDGAIRGMLHELDPYSTYIPTEKMASVNERFEGYFHGVGIEFVVQNKIPIVVAPIIGGPSERLGIRSGDRILKIDKTETVNLSEEQIQRRLRGKKGSRVVLTLKRPNVVQPFKISLNRERIPLYSIICSLLIDEATGYIRIGQFSKSTADELEDKLCLLEQSGMQQLILDLRSNTGGFLDQAIAVADKFLLGNRKIVYTKGRIPNSNDIYYSTDIQTHPQYPLIVLVDNGTASAAEIVAGALQDWDRALIVGARSFGKALVQSQIPLQEGSAVRVTVARYYTPCGRLIQASSADDGLYLFKKSGLSAAQSAESQQYKTKGGRTIYGGGGIVPDVHVLSEDITTFTHSLFLNNLFFEYGSLYAADNAKLAANFQAFKSYFRVTHGMLEEFQRLIIRRDLDIDKHSFRKDQVFYKKQIKGEIARNLWNSKQYYEVIIEDDAQIQKSLLLFNEAKKLASLNLYKNKTQSYLWDYSESTKKY